MSISNNLTAKRILIYPLLGILLVIAVPYAFAHTVFAIGIAEGGVGIAGEAGGAEGPHGGFGGADHAADTNSGGDHPSDDNPGTTSSNAFHPNTGTASTTVLTGGSTHHSSNGNTTTYPDQQQKLDPIDALKQAIKSFIKQINAPTTPKQ